MLLREWDKVFSYRWQEVEKSFLEADSMHACCKQHGNHQRSEGGQVVEDSSLDFIIPAQPLEHWTRRVQCGGCDNGVIYRKELAKTVHPKQTDAVGFHALGTGRHNRCPLPVRGIPRPLQRKLHFWTWGDTVLSICSEIRSNEDFKVAADNFFSSLNLVEGLTRGIQYVGTLRQNRLRDCKLQDEKTLRKVGQGSHDYRVDNDKGIVVVRWFDRKAVTLVSNFVSVESIQQVKRYDRKTKLHIDITRPAIVGMYNSFRGKGGDRPA